MDVACAGLVGGPEDDLPDVHMGRAGQREGDGVRNVRGSQRRHSFVHALRSGFVAHADDAELGLDHARVHRGESNACPYLVQTHRLVDGPDRVLGRVVDVSAGVDLTPRDAPEYDHVAAGSALAPFAQAGKGRPDGVEHTLDVGVDHRGPILGVAGVDRGDAETKASVRDDDVDAAALEELGDASGVADVALGRGRLGADLARECGEPVGAAGDEDDLGPELGQGSRGCGSDAGRGARDEGKAPTQGQVAGRGAGHKAKSVAALWRAGAPFDGAANDAASAMSTLRIAFLVLAGVSVGCGVTALATAMNAKAGDAGSVGASRRALTPPGPREPTSKGRVAEWTLFHGGTFHTDIGSVGVSVAGGTGAVGGRTAEALLVHDGRIAAVGDFDSVSRSEGARNAVRIDIGGGHAYPGFHDSHSQFERSGEVLGQVWLAGCATHGDMISRVEHAAREVPAGQWVVGFGWDETSWSDAPSLAEISSAVTAGIPDHPVLLVRACGGSGFINASAHAGSFSADKISRPFDAKRDGLVCGAALETVRGARGAAAVEERKRRILRAQAVFLRAGVTCVHDIGVAREDVQLFRDLAEAGELAVRVASYVDAGTLEGRAPFEGLMPLNEPKAGHWVAGVSFDVDGTLGARSAALLEEYSDAPGERGALRMDLDALAKGITMAAKCGLQPAVIADGDRAFRLALDGFRRANGDVEGFALLRPRLEHASLMAPNDEARLGDLGLVLSMQPGPAASAGPWVVARLGEARAHRAFAWAALAKAATWPLAFGSGPPAGAFADDPVGSLRLLHAALTRSKPRVEVRSALSSMTSGGAFALREEMQRGSLARGFLCDLTVVDIDLSRADRATASAVLDAKILMTVIEGVVVYTAAR